MLTADMAIRMFVDELNGFTPEQLTQAINSNYSLARGIKLNRSSQLSVWRGLISTARLMDKRGTEAFVNSISYVRVYDAIRKARPDLASALTFNLNGERWLYQQVAEVKELVFR